MLRGPARGRSSNGRTVLRRNLARFNSTGPRGSRFSGVSRPASRIGGSGGSERKLVSRPERAHGNRRPAKQARRRRRRRLGPRNKRHGRSRRPVPVSVGGGVRLPVCNPQIQTPQLGSRVDRMGALWPVHKGCTRRSQREFVSRWNRSTYPGSQRRFVTSILSCSTIFPSRNQYPRALAFPILRSFRPNESKTRSKRWGNMGGERSIRVLRQRPDDFTPEQSPSNVNPGRPAESMRAALRRLGTIPIDRIPLYRETSTLSS